MNQKNYPENYPQDPQELWNHFYNITRCPRPSKKEEKMQEYVISVAKENNLEYKVDEVGNVVIYVPASPGKENSEPVIVQNHMDMVTDATPDRDINFETDPIDIFVEDGWIKADRTTLGSDNGIGCAAALATITDKSLVHPRLELLFTTDEETGLNGAWGVQSSYFKGKKMINLDTEEWGSLYIGCAGGIDYHFDQSFSLQDSSLSTYKVKVGGLVGGHSGIDIQRGRANAIKLVVDSLMDAPTSFELASIDGGRAHNIIPRDASFNININDNDLGLWKEHLNSMSNKWKSYLVKDDQNFSISIDKVDNQKALNENDKNRILNFLTLFPHGAHNYLESDPELVAISNNLAIVKLEEGKLFVQTSLRFFDRNEIVQIEQQMNALAQAFNMEVSKHGEYPSWKPVLENSLLEKVKDVYKTNFGGKDAIVTAIHAGLECGILRDRIGEIDAVSFGPTIMGAHSPQERLEIKTVKPFWDLFAKTLESI